MPRSGRLDIPHLLQHVIVRDIERRDIFLNDDDRNDLRNASRSCSKKRALKIDTMPFPFPHVFSRPFPMDFSG
jgi:REP element-mobilizing transposase RayT